MYLSFRRGSAYASKKAQKIANLMSRESVKNVTVIRHAAIGDFVVLRPFLVELRKFFPNAKITLSVDGNAIYGMPEDLVDDIHIIDKKQKNNPSKSTSFFQRYKQIKELQEQDVMFDFTDSSLTLMLTIFSKSKLKIGYPYRSFRRWFYDISVLRSDFTLETDSMMHQLNILGANTQYPLDYAYPRYEKDTEHPYIIYFAGASMQNRCWPEDKFSALILRLREEFPGYKHVILKGIRPEEQFNSIYEPLKEYDDVIHQESMPLDEVMPFLAKSSLVVAGDTGIRNMAISMEAPTLGVMWAHGIAAIRYLPKNIKHTVVFNENFEIPSVNEVEQGCTALLNRLRK